jgi:hypothetical protein
MTYQQKYYKNNQEKRMVESQKYREIYSDRLNENRRGRIFCEMCNKEISKGSKSVHVKSKKHKENIKIKLLSIKDIEDDTRDIIAKEYINDLKKMLPIIYKYEDEYDGYYEQKKRFYHNFNVEEALNILSRYPNIKPHEKHLLALLGHLSTVRARFVSVKYHYKNHRLSKYLYYKWKRFYKSLPLELDMIKSIMTSGSNEDIILFEYFGYLI